MIIFKLKKKDLPFRWVFFLHISVRFVYYFYKIYGSLTNPKKLTTEQTTLTNILEQSIDFQQVKKELATSILSHSDWKIEQWEDAMLETAYANSRKWKDGFL